VGKIKENPKYFYSYAKSLSKVKNSITALLNVEKKVTDNEDVADILQTQFCAVFSDPNCPDTFMPEFVLPPITTKNTETVLSLELIEDAIFEIKLDSAPGPDGIPAILLKKCASSLSALTLSVKKIPVVIRLVISWPVKSMA
jgi:hypothetical protein